MNTQRSICVHLTLNKIHSLALRGCESRLLVAREVVLVIGAVTQPQANNVLANHNSYESSCACQSRKAISQIRTVHKVPDH